MFPEFFLMTTTGSQKYEYLGTIKDNIVVIYNPDLAQHKHSVLTGNVEAKLTKRGQ